MRTSKLAVGTPRDEIKSHLAYLECLSGEMHSSMALTLTG